MVPYLYTLTEITRVIREKDPRVVPNKGSYVSGKGKVAPLSHLLWMVNEIGKIDDPEKAGPLVGYVLAHIEFQGFWDNKKSLDLLRKDVDGR